MKKLLILLPFLVFGCVKKVPNVTAQKQQVYYRIAIVKNGDTTYSSQKVVNILK